jgi:3-deoxy-D-manno-octulosonic-acid transferase
MRSPNYAKRWGERFGFVDHPGSDKEIIWLHAVSVGETLAAVTLVKALQEKYPGYRLMVTCMTPTGSERISAAFGGSVEHSYAPYDMPDAVARFLGRVRPKLLIIMETELWPNTIAACNKRNIPVILANGRLSDKSSRAYRRINSLARPMLNGLHTVAAQHTDDAQRFQSLGLPDTAVTVTGNIKFDLKIDPALKDAVAQLSKDWRGTTQRRVFLAASTHKGEDERILAAFTKIKTQLESALLVLVPRHPERFNQVAELCHSAGFSVVRRSANTSVGAADILLGDSMGELMIFFGACDLAFVGGSFVPTGGHNMIEAAAWGTPVLTGPHLFNFTEAAQLLTEAGGMKVCQNFDDLADQCILLLQDESQRIQMGDAARHVAEANRGALDRLLAVITQII